MDIGSVISSVSAIQQSTTRNQIETALAAKALQTQQAEGEAVIQLIEQAAQVQQDGLDITA